MNKSRNYVTILGVKVSSNTIDELLSEIQNKLSKKIQFYIVTPNPEIILQAQNDPELSKSLNSADFSIADGFGLKLANSSLPIIKGRQLMIDLFKLANELGLKIYLLGSTKEVIKKSLEKIKKEYPNIKAEGDNGPVFDREVATSLQIEVVKGINNFKPDLLFVAFGAPKQEIWINKNIKDLKIIGAMAVGGGLDYYSGFVRPVPNIFAVLQLEWLWRLIIEPKRILRILNATVKWPLTLLVKSVKN